MERTVNGKEKKKANVFLNIMLVTLYILLNIVFYAIVVIVTKKMCTTAYDYGYQIFGDVSVQEEPGYDVEIRILEGESSMEIAKKLDYNQIVVNAYTFYIRTQLTIGEDNPIIPGTYLLNTSMTYDQVLQTITDPEKSMAATSVPLDESSD